MANAVSKPVACMVVFKVTTARDKRVHSECIGCSRKMSGKMKETWLNERFRGARLPKMVA